MIKTLLTNDENIGKYIIKCPKCKCTFSYDDEDKQHSYKSDPSYLENLQTKFKSTLESRIDNLMESASFQKLDGSDRSYI